MKDYLLDIVRNTAWLGNDFVVRITGTQGQPTTISGYTDGIIMLAETKKEVKEFEGVFGLRNLSMLSGLLNMESFKSDKATVSVNTEVKNEVSVPVDVIFDSPDMKSTYRLMSQMALPKEVKMAQQPTYHVTVEQPTRTSIQNFVTLSSIYSSTGTDSFNIKTEDGKLYLCLGNDGNDSHRAKYVFTEEAQGSLNTSMVWKVSNFINVMKLSNGADCTVRFANEIISVEIDTGLCTYNFMLPGRNT